MIITRRRAIGVGGGLLAALLVRPAAATAGKIVDIAMQGNANGSHVWFDPIGILIKPGQTVRWTNLDQGNSHTTTAYAPQNEGRPRRIPQAAKAWDSDYLMPDETFSVTFTEQGVYDYCCIPHEHAGMVGRIIVGEPNRSDWMDKPNADGDLPEEALAGFPTVEDIMAKGTVRRT